MRFLVADGCPSAAAGCAGVPSDLVGLDCCPWLAALDGAEVEPAMSDTSQTEMSAVLGILRNACSEMHGVQSELKSVAKLGEKLESLEKTLGKLEEKIEESAAAHKVLQEQYLTQSHQHDLQIQAIQIQLKDYNTLVSTVSKLDKNLYAYVLIAVIATGIVSALFAGLPGWLERYSPQKVSVIFSQVHPTRGKG